MWLRRGVAFTGKGSKLERWVVSVASPWRSIRRRALMGPSTPKLICTCYWKRKYLDRDRHTYIQTDTQTDRQTDTTWLYSIDFFVINH